MRVSAFAFAAFASAHAARWARTQRPNMPDVRRRGQSFALRHLNCTRRVPLALRRLSDEIGEYRRVDDHARQCRRAPCLFADVQAGDGEVEELERRLALEIVRLAEDLVALDRLVEQGFLASAFAQVAAGKQPVADLTRDPGDRAGRCACAGPRHRAMQCDERPLVVLRGSHRARRDSSAHGPTPSPRARVGLARRWFPRCRSSLMACVRKRTASRKAPAYNACSPAFSR